jgi:two-component system sensor histidine kinase CiaH
MFDGTRKRLTLSYTVLTMLFLIGFMAASYWGFKMVIYWNEGQDTLLYAKEEAQEHIRILANPQHLNTVDELVPEFGEKMFVYVYDNHASLVKATELNKELHSAIASIIKKWKLPQDSAAQHIINTSKGKNIVMMASQRIYDQGRLLGVIYVGKDVTDFYGILNIYLMIIACIGLGFLILVYIVGTIMAKKAMEPIYKSFGRQRQFTADASHELRTPLAVLLSSTEAVLADKESRMSAFAFQILLDMKDEIKKINKLVADLLTLARVDAEVQKIFREKFDIVPVMKGAVHSLSLLAAQKSIHIEMKIPDRLIVFADKERLHQLIYILLDNAIKYTMENGKISLSAHMSEEHNFKFLVEDTGIGIAPEDQKHIFERFYRVDKARSREQGGTGLGLSIAKWIVDAHNGSITVKSILGQGTTFYVMIHSAITG